MSISAVSASSEALVLNLFVQLIIIYSFSRIVVFCARRYLGQTAVAGEILAGILLGPSFLGALFPELMASVFTPNTSTIFVGLAQLGLLLLMFHIGMEFDLGKVFATGRKTVITISAIGIIVPFSLGFITADFFWNRLAGPQYDQLGFKLFFAVAMSITAIPILGRIFMELGLSKTRVASLVIGAATLDDVTGWLLLGVISSIVASNFSLLQFAYKLLALLLLAVAMLRYIAPWLQKQLENQRHDDNISATQVSIILISLLVLALCTSKLGIFALFGGLLLGISMSRYQWLQQQWTCQVSPLVNAIFLPIFFAYTGLRTDIGTLQGMAGVWLCGSICLIAFVGKFGGGYLAARCCGESHTDATIVGVCMNTRALMELIVLNIGYDMGVIPRNVFTMLVIMAIVSTFITTPLIRYLATRPDSDYLPVPVKA